MERNAAYRASAPTLLLLVKEHTSGSILFGGNSYYVAKGLRELKRIDP
ncbi:hypothetical protein BRCON_2809 [Candidatus Sumerlaea chitinivorans]|uniref:Uncharacterized protein n=1 Tax=Sumerlaea chitinivorans TaxID=2250252 RepID=A0A2Z4Y8J0_SUMC1|nr:hypothetical protein BRCON_2809 [Candidatus Sumerlaea chitinivorans]